MADATNDQIQRFANERLRPWAEHARALYLEAKDHQAVIDDIYEALATHNNPNNWTDNRTDGPPHLLTANDVLALNTAIVAFIAAVEGGDSSQFDDQWPVVLDACVRPVQG